MAKKDTTRFVDDFVLVKTDPKTEADLARGLEAALAGRPFDEKQPAAWQRGYQIGTYRRGELAGS